MATAVALLDASFSVTDRKLYVPVVILSTHDHTKLLEQSKSGFKRTNDCNKSINSKDKPIFR